MRRQHLGAAIVFVVLSIAFTWPLAPNLDRAVADPGDPLINIWILDWDWWATLHQPLSLFHANVFHPARYTLALSENLYGVAVLLFPLRALGVGPVAAYNVAMLAGFAFCGFAAYLLGFRLTRSFAAGMAAGVFYAFVPFRFVHLSHVQHVWGGWLPLLLVALLAYHERPSWKRGWLLAAVFVMNGLTNIHYLLFGALAIAVTAALLIRRAYWRELAVPMFVAVLVLLPFLYPYTQVGMQRTAEEVLRYSAMPVDWLPGATDSEKKLWPGALAVVVSALALFVRPRAKVGLALLWIAIGFMGSLGLHFVFHEFLFGAVPGFRAIRAPSRWAVIAYVGMAILIALFTKTVEDRRSRLSGQAGLPALHWLVPVAFAVALWSAPVRWFLLDPQTPPVYRWLAQQKVSAIVELPMDMLSSEYEYMLHATAHHQRMVNGVSGFSPPLRDELSRLQHTDAFLDKAPVELVIVHSDRYGGEPAAAMRNWLHRELERGRLRYVTRFDAKTGADWVFHVERASARSDQASARSDRRAEARPTLPRELGVFLYGGPTCIRSVAGALLFPPGGHPYRGRAELYGWAFSPHGIARVDLWFENRRVRYPARLTPLDDRRCPGPPAVRFERVFPSRPEDVREKTDVQVEVTDRRGQTAVFESRWISWE